MKDLTTIIQAHVDMVFVIFADDERAISTLDNYESIQDHVYQCHAGSQWLFYVNFYVFLFCFHFYIFFI